MQHPTKISLILTTIVLISAMTTAHGNPRLYIFDCGGIEFTDVSAFGLSNEETSVREMFVPCYLIENVGQRLLWDGGLPLAIAGQPRQEQQPGVFVEYKRSLLEQLDDLGLKPSDIDFIAFSHFHFDHVGAANAFTTSTLLIQKTENDAAFKHADDNPAFNPMLYNKLAYTPRKLMAGDFDVFGDGKVMIYSAPGHTPGHQTLLVDMQNTGPVMLSGDLYHFVESRKLRRTPEFNTDAAQTLKSMDRIENVLKATGATLWIEHNKALADTLDKAPAYYD